MWSFRLHVFVERRTLYYKHYRFALQNHTFQAIKPVSLQRDSSRFINTFIYFQLMIYQILYYLMIVSNL